jgi:hypothetical protein
MPLHFRIHAEEPRELQGATSALHVATAVAQFSLVALP